MNNQLGLRLSIDVYKNQAPWVKQMKKSQLGTEAVTEVNGRSLYPFFLFGKQR